MTTIRLDNGSTSQANKFYLELHAEKVKRINDKKIILVPIPKPEPKWSQGPEDLAVDLLTITRKFVVTCTIDKHTNKDASWNDDDLADAAQVMDRLYYMQENGGVVTLTRSLAADGYGTDPVLGTGGTRTYNCVLKRIEETEKPEDQIPAHSYSVIIEFQIAEDR